MGEMVSRGWEWGGDSVGGSGVEMVLVGVGVGALQLEGTQRL